MQEPNNQSLFANPEEFNLEEKKDLTPVLPDIVSKNTLADDSTVEVRFCTGGRLSAPPILHFRDYTMLASQLLADLSSADNPLPSITKALNTMVVEEFDCGLLHLEEMKEVLLNIYGKWWGNKLSGYKYFLDEDIKDEDALLKPENISTVDIPLGALEIVPLDPEIKEPINIKCHGTTVKFIFPRVQDIGTADDFLKVKFAVQEQQFHKLSKILEYNSQQTDPDKMKVVDINELNAYDEYLKERERWRTIFIRAHEICAINNYILKSFEQRVEALAAKDSKITIKHWQKYNEFLEGKGKFGLKNEVEFFSEVLGKKVRRPFQFHTWSFIPTDSVEFAGDGDDEISFG